MKTTCWSRFVAACELRVRRFTTSALPLPLIAMLTIGCDRGNPTGPGVGTEDTMAVGTVKLITQAALKSIQLSPGRNGRARYLLAFAHEAPIISVATPGPPPLQPQFDSFTVTIAAATTVSAMALHALPTPLVRPQLERVDTSASARAVSASSGNEDLTQRREPWKVADEATIQAMILDWRTITIRVMKIYASGYLVVMMPTTDAAAFAGMEPMLDSAAAFIAQRVAPRYDRILSSVRPRTSGSVPQLVVLLIPDRYADVTAGLSGAGQWIEIGYGNRMAAEGWIEILAHELSHAWDFTAWASEGRTSGYVHSQSWYKEGIASFLATDALREWNGLSFMDNLPLRWHLDPGGRYYHAAWNANGIWFGGGYGPAAAFLRDAVWTLMYERDYPYDQARDAVISTAKRGWYGCTENHCTLTGLADRMSEELGREWQPADALLDWTLSEAVDDVVQSGRYRVPSFTGTSFLLNPQPVIPFAPVHTITAGGGSTTTIGLPQYATGFIDVRVGEVRAQLTISNTSAVRWKLMRIE